MNTIQPTPSQSAVVLKNFLSEKGCALKLSETQEAVARMWGYASWQALASDIPVRGDKPKKSKPALARMSQVLDDELDEPDVPQSMEYFQALSEAWPETAAQDESGIKLTGLLNELEGALVATGLLKAYSRQQGRDEQALEEGIPYLQVSFDTDLSELLTTELVFTLRDSQLDCYVRTWEMLDGLRPSSNYRIFRERSGDYDTHATRPEDSESLSALVRNALREAEVHKSHLKRLFGGD